MDVCLRSFRFRLWAAAEGPLRFQLWRCFGFWVRAGSSGFRVKLKRCGLRESVEGSLCSRVRAFEFRVWAAGFLVLRVRVEEFRV